MSNPWVKGKVWTQEELGEWAIKQAIVNEIYQKASDEQLELWAKGINTHNPHNAICAVVDTNDNERIVGYTQCDGGECCPDFSCCGSVGWPLSKRQKFVELHRSGNEAAAQAMMMAGLSEAIEGLPLHDGDVYIAGQAGETQH